MTTAYTSLLGLALPVTGELQGTWGDTVNNSITSLLDTAVAGTTTLSTDGDVTLSTTTGAANQARQAILLCSGARTALRTITAPAQSKIYTVINATTGGYSVKVVGVGPTTGVTIPAGQTAQIAWNGSDFVLLSSTTSSGIVPVASGGTGLSSGTSGGVLYFSASGTLASSAALAANALVIGGGAGVAPSTTTTGTGVVTALGVNVGSAGAFVVNGGALGTPSSGTVTNLTGTASININGTVGATTPATGSFTVLTASSDSTFSSTGALTISKGTTGQQPGSPVTGMLRYNTTTNQFEGYSGASPAWNSVGGATLSNDTSTASNLYPLFANATSGAATTVYTSNAKLLYKPSTGELQASELVASNGILVNSGTVSASYTISSGNNGFSVGPVTVNSGVSVTVSSGQRWLVL